MPKNELRRRSSVELCGVTCWHPSWLQKYANTKMFIIVYGLLGTIQAMCYMYFMVTLTTLEKRFKIPSQTTGIILSGNEISQIMLSLILSYIGGQRNRPRWIAWGIVFCGLSCYILALPHFIYGAGDEALQLTKEYHNEELGDNTTTSSSLLLVKPTISSAQRLCGTTNTDKVCEPLLSLLPLILIFLSQFVLGVGNTLYYSLGQTYLDDNTKKTNTPLMMALAMSLRMIGPIVGFPLGYISLNMFIDPSKTPLINNKDPRWLGAWWFGWMVLGTLMVLFSGLLGLFPKELPKKNEKGHYNSHMPHALRLEERINGLPLGSAFSSNAALDTITARTSELPKLADFPKALMRLLRNKLLMFNIISGICFILGATGQMTFISKYMEVQFHRNAQNATIIVGPISIFGMIIGLIASGIVISKYKPNPSKVLAWNIVVGMIYVIGQISYMFLYCPDSLSLTTDGKVNLTAPCSSNCSCEDIPYSPVCHIPTKTTFFSACHAGCSAWDAKSNNYFNCSCLPEDIFTTTTTIPTTSTDFEELLTTPSTTLEPTLSPTRMRRAINSISNVIQPGICMEGCDTVFYTFSALSMVINWFGSSGRIGNLLVNYRSVSVQDKSFAQGLMLMLVSLFALIPGPIIFGRVIDSACLVWTKTCNGTGNCQLYNQTSLRYLMNGMAACFSVLGVFFDLLVWKHGRNLDLYGEKEAQRLEEVKKRNQPITPLLAKQ